MNRASLWLQSLRERHGIWVLVALAAIVIAGVGLRAHAALERSEGVQEDSIKYYDLAEALYLEGSYDAPEVERDDAYHPASPLFHAGVWYLTGGVNPKASRLLLALLSAAMIVATYLLARRLALPRGPAAARRAAPGLPEAAGLIAALLIAVNPSSIDFFRSHMNEPIASIALVGSVLAFLWASDRGSAWAWLLPGALIGLTALARPEALLFGLAFAALALLRAARERGAGGGLLASGALLAGLALAIAPWTIRNAVALDRFEPISTGGGNAIFIGSYLPGDGDHFETFDRRVQLLKEEAPTLTPAEREALLANPDLTLGEMLEAIAREREPELAPDRGLAKLGREQLADAVTEHPIEYAGVLAEKTWNMWGQGAAAEPRQGGPGALGDAFHLLVVALGAVGLVVLALRRRWEAAVIGSVLLIATAVGAVLLAPPRRNVDLLPLVSALAGFAAAWLAAQLSRRRV